MALYSPPLLCYYWPVYYMYIIFLYLLSQIHYIHIILYNYFKNNKEMRKACIYTVLYNDKIPFTGAFLFFSVCVWIQILKLRQDEKWCPAPSGKKALCLRAGVGREPVFFVAAFWSGVWTLLNWERGREKGHGSFTVRFLTGVSWIFFNRCLFICYLPLGPHPEV